MVATELVVRFDESPTLDLNNNPPATDSTEKLTVPSGKKRRVKSPTPARALSTTPTRRSRSKTPFNLYLSRHSADPNEPTKWRSITPFINRKDKELTPFELGKDLKSQLISHKMVFDKASVMDISESDFEPVRYITSDVSVIDRASVMDVSNIEVIYLVEEYDDGEIIEEDIQADEESKKKKPKKGRKSKSIDKDDSPVSDKKSEGKSKKKKKVESKSPSPPQTQMQPKLTLKLELGGGSKINKKMFEKKSSVEQGKPPTKKTKLAMELEEQAKQAEKISDEPVKSKTGENEKDDEYNSEDEIEDQEEIDVDADSDQESDNNSVSGHHDDSERQSHSLRESVSQIEGDDDDQESILSEKSPSPIKEPARSPSPKLPPPRPASYWKNLANAEGKDLMEKMKLFYSIKREKPHYPTFINKLKDICSTETNTIRMVCAVYGPDLTIKWFKDDILMKYSDRYNFTENDEIVSLEIYDCKPSDTADYSCTIANKYQKITTTCYVNVCEMGGHQDEPYPPKIEGFEDSYHYIDDKLIIQCTIKGIPRPDVTWSRNGIEIMQCKECTVLEGAHGIYQLIINHPSSKDSGIYVVKAINSRGVQERQHCVEFLISNRSRKSRF